MADLATKPCVTETVSTSKEVSKQRALSINLVLIGALALIFVVSFAVGRYPVSPLDVIKILLSRVLPIEHSWSPTLETVVLQIRLPRIIAAVLIGAGLSISGASFQGVFRNPIVSPQVLGVTAGAGFGAALGIMVSGNPFVIEVFAFAMGLAAVGLAWVVSKSVRGDQVLTLVLAGMAISALFTALISYTQYVADPFQKLPTIVFWLMGSLAKVQNSDLFVVAGIIIAGITVLMFVRWKINVLAMGDEEARALGVNTGRLRAIITVCCTLITAAAVCISGIIGWVGLLIPHVGRILVGPCHKKLLPVTVLLGAAYLLLIDDLCRSVTATEIPIGILTAVIGVPVFLYLIRRRNKGWS